MIAETRIEPLHGRAALSRRQRNAGHCGHRRSDGRLNARQERIRHDGAKSDNDKLHRLAGRQKTDGLRPRPTLAVFRW